METCPSCNAPVDQMSKYCNECGYRLVSEETLTEKRISSGRSYKLRSPILESAVLYDDRTEKKHGMLLILSYAFWFFAIVLIILGAVTIYKNYTIELLEALREASLFFILAFFCFIVPGMLNILIDIEENLSIIAKEVKKDRID